MRKCQDQMAQLKSMLILDNLYIKRLSEPNIDCGVKYLHRPRWWDQSCHGQLLQAHVKPQWRRDRSILEAHKISEQKKNYGAIPERPYWLKLNNTYLVSAELSENSTFFEAKPDSYGGSEQRTRPSFKHNHLTTESLSGVYPGFIIVLSWFQHKKISAKSGLITNS